MDSNIDSLISELKLKYREEALEAVRQAEIRGYERARTEYELDILRSSEELRLKYRSEALEAVQVAEKRGFDRAEHQHKLSTAHETEELRMKYRAEALDAISAAESRGFEHGKKLCESQHVDEILQLKSNYEALISTLEDKLRRQNSVSSFVDSNANGALTELQIKRVMEIVYREIKAMWSSDSVEDRDKISTVKSVLLRTSNILLQSIPNYSSRSPEIGDASRWLRPKVLQVGLSRSPPKLYLQITINHTDEVPQQKIFRTKVVTIYKIETVVRIWRSVAPPPLSGIQDRRHREFSLLCANLKREFPSAMIPELPAIETSDFQGNSLVQRRKRHLAIWLQYIVMHDDIQVSDYISEFLSLQSISSIAGSVATHSPRTSSFLSDRLASVASDSKLTSKSRQMLLRELSMRDISTVMRDISQLRPQCQYAVESSGKLVASFSNLSICFRMSTSIFSMMALVEAGHASENKSWLIMEGCGVKIAPILNALSMNCQIGFYEPLSFLGVSCLRAAEAACQDAQEKQQNVSLTDTERIRAAEDVSLEWMNSRRTRSCLQLPLLIFTAQRAAAEYRKLAAEWEALAALLEGIGNNQHAGISNSAVYPNVPLDSQPVHLPNAGRVNTSVHLERAIVPTGLRRIATRVLKFVLGDDDKAQVIAPSHLESSNQTVEPKTIVGENQLESSKLSSACCEDEHDDPSVHRAMQPPNKHKLGSRGEVDDDTTVQRNEIYRKARHTSAPIQPTASRRHKTKVVNSTPDDAFVVPRAIHPVCWHQSDELLYTSAQNPIDVGRASGTFPDIPELPKVILTEIEESEPRIDREEYNRRRRSGTEHSHQPVSEPCENTTKLVPELNPESTTSSAVNHYCHERIEITEPVLASGWEKVHTSDGSTYYYHKISRISRWDPPDEKVAAALENRINHSQKKIDEALERRKAERMEHQRQQAEIVQESEMLQGIIKEKMIRWSSVPSLNKRRPLYELLGSLHSLLPILFPEGSLHPPLTYHSSVAEVKKAYLKIVRIIHPDKLSGDIDLETKLTAESAFVIITECYNEYRKANNIN